MIFSPIIISLKVATIATVIVLAIGLLLARIFTKYSFKGKDLLEVLITLPMIMPPSVLGYGLLLVLGRRSLLGGFLYNTFGVSLVFTVTAAVIASVIVALPLMYQSCKGVLLNLDKTYEDEARIQGAGDLIIFFRIILPIIWPGVISGIVLSFARALGEFGATLMIAGNIPGKTQTIPVAMYFAVEGGDKATANTLLGIVVVFSFLLIFILNFWLKKRQKDM